MIRCLDQSEPPGLLLRIEPALYRMARNGRTLQMTHRRYPLHRLFKESTDQERVYRAAVAPLLGVARRGGRATAIFYG